MHQKNGKSPQIAKNGDFSYLNYTKSPELQQELELNIKATVLSRLKRHADEWCWGYNGDPAKELQQVEEALQLMKAIQRGVAV